MTGKVDFFNDQKGWGFIKPDNGSHDVFVHHSGIAGEGHKTLYKGDHVEFDVVMGRKGYQAENVTVVD